MHEEIVFIRSDSDKQSDKVWYNVVVTRAQYDSDKSPVTEW